MGATLSVIIPVHNNEDTVSAQLTGVGRALATSIPTEIVVVSNCSTDSSSAMAESWSAEHGVSVRVERADAKPSEPYARNVGLERSEGELIAYCDGDDIVEPTWIEGMVAALSAGPYATGPVRTDQLNEPWLAGVRGTALFEELPILYGTVPYAHGCNMGIRRQALVEIGGFDERFPIGCDVAMAIRAYRSGISLSFEPRASVQYRLRDSMRAMYRQGRAYGRTWVKFRALLPDVVDSRAELRANLRRVGWLAKSLPRLTDRAVRARWIWVMSQLDGEARAPDSGRQGPR